MIRKRAEIMKRISLILAAFILTVSRAYAGDNTEMGLGASTCGQFSDIYRKAPELAERAYFGWAQGMMTGMNLGSGAHGGIVKKLDSIQVEEQQRTIRDFCNDHPLAPYRQAVTILYFRLENGTIPLH
jgi:hypothetical protein